MRLGIAIQETWGFFNEIFVDFQKKYEVEVFKRRQVAVAHFPCQDKSILVSAGPYEGL